MSNIIKVDPKQFGVAEAKAQEIELAFTPMVEAMEALEPDLEAFINSLDVVPTEEECATAAGFLKQYVSIRTATAAAHKEQKAVFLNAGRFVDGLKNSQKKVSDNIEAELTRIKMFHINLEKGRLTKLHNDRADEISKYLLPGAPKTDYSLMSEDVWKTFLAGTKVAYEGYQSHTVEANESNTVSEGIITDTAQQQATELAPISESHESDILIINGNRETKAIGSVTFDAGTYIVTIDKIMK